MNLLLLHSHLPACSHPDAAPYLRNGISMLHACLTLKIRYLPKASFFPGDIQSFLSPTKNSPHRSVWLTLDVPLPNAHTHTYSRTQPLLPTPSANAVSRRYRAAAKLFWNRAVWLGRVGASWPPRTIPSHIQSSFLFGKAQDGGLLLDG